MAVTGENTNVNKINRTYGNYSANQLRHQTSDFEEKNFVLSK